MRVALVTCWFQIVPRDDDPPLILSGGKSDHEVMKVSVGTVPELMVSSGKGSIQRLHRTHWRLPKKESQRNCW